MICECCRAADAEVAVSDSTNEGANLCLACGAAWLTEVAALFDASLRVFMGTATPAQREAHTAALRRAAAEDAELIARDAERRARLAAAARKQAATVKANREKRIAAAEALRETRAAAAGRYVQANGKRSLDEVASAVGISTSQMSRLMRYAVERGYVTRTVGATGGIAPGPVVPRDELAAA